ncbi:hypothetical protein SAMN04488512_1502 [Sulfitobacter litoralis]|uniref:ApeA N-terminal domain-containing protein n=1 Tax=Sulfitobacter litoralis TaxID=335975 RepID=A0ABY0T042_9RHOB|nr:HEPN domain-containing protein [Sulfitobacter litoralis]SDP79345.1 hypothetical protein SAMN04488512_1502 [Sulfitobacter litoralis]
MANFKYDGVFIERQEALPGHLKSDGEQTQLSLAHSHDVARFYQSNSEVHGSLDDGAKASLIDCISQGNTTYGLRDNDSARSQMFPHFIVVGDEWVDAEQEFVSQIEYFPADVDCLSGFRRDFGMIHPTKNEFQKILVADEARLAKISKERDWDKTDRDAVDVGDHPILQYYSGNFQIVKVDCKDCLIEISNRPSHGRGSSRGVKIENQITVNLKFPRPLKLEKAATKLLIVHSFLELCLGKRQEYQNIKLKPADRKDHKLFDLHWSYANERVRKTGRHPHAGDVLADFGRRKSEFSKLLGNWVDTSEQMAEARGRFSSCFFSSSYSPDRVVAAANIFDLLPEDRVPKARQLDEETLALVKEFKPKFRSLPESFARQEMLGAIGRIGKASLRDKINHRVAILTKHMGSSFSELTVPCQQGVICRNHYVHGSEAAFDYQNEFPSFAFITDTLEFVFALSDLLEMGWSYRDWREHGTTQSHAFGSYCVNYAGELHKLKELLA